MNLADARFAVNITVRRQVGRVRHWWKHRNEGDNMERLTAIWRRIPKPLRAGWVTAWVTFVSTVLAIATGLLPELATAISARNFGPFYQSLNLAATAAISAATAFLAGCVNALWRWRVPIEQAYQDPPG